MKKCPYCAEMIQDEAIKCRYCGSDLRVAPPAMTSPPAEPQAPSEQPPSGEPGGVPSPLEPSTFPREAAGGEPGAPAGGEPAAPAGDEADVPAAGQRTAGLSDTVVMPVGAAGAVGGPASMPPEGGPASPARVGEGAVRFSHSGYRYILGYGAEYFGIWDRQVPGGPTLRFPRTDDGWVEAWNRFTAMEPRAVPVPTTGTPAPDVARSAGQVRPIHTLGVWLVGLLAAVAALSVLAIIFRFGQLSLLDRIRDQGSGSVSLGEAQAADNRLTAVSVPLGILLVAAIVVWCMWQFRGQSNLRALGAANLRYSPGWAVGWWFIPFANVVMPYLTVRELWKASDPEGGSVGWQMVKTSPLLPFWWACWLGYAVLVSIGSSILASADANGVASVNTRIAVTWWSIAGQVAYVVAAALAILIVRQVEQRQRTKQSRLDSWTASATTGSWAAS